MSSATSSLSRNIRIARQVLAASVHEDSQLKIERHENFTFQCHLQLDNFYWNTISVASLGQEVKIETRIEVNRSIDCSFQWSYHKTNYVLYLRLWSYIFKSFDGSIASLGKVIIYRSSQFVFHFSFAGGRLHLKSPHIVRMAIKSPFKTLLIPCWLIDYFEYSVQAHCHDTTVLS